MNPFHFRGDFGGDGKTDNKSQSASFFPSTTANPDLVYPEGTASKSTRTSGSGDPARNSPGHRDSGFALAIGAINDNILLTDTSDGLFALDSISLEIDTGSGTIESFIGPDDGFGLGI